MKLLSTALLLACATIAPGAAKPEMKRETIIETAAMSEGLCLHNLFQSKMVIQRDKPCKVWGWADAGKTVSVSLGGAQQTTTARDDRYWETTFPAMPTHSEGIAMVVKEGQTVIQLDDILVGDVWVLGGQSNMEYPITKVENGQLEIATAHYPQIRMLTIPRNIGPEPKPGFARLMEWSNFHKKHFRKGYWDACSPETVSELSAIGYIFARNLHMAAQVPIGIIDTSVGGTTVETWIPDAALRKSSAEPITQMMAEWDKQVAEWDPAADLEKRIKKHHKRVQDYKEQGRPLPSKYQTVPNAERPGPAYNYGRPGNRFAGMIEPLRGVAVKGAIFHQGFNNCLQGMKTAYMYADAFPVMIASWREAFGDPELPFGILSLCTQGNKQTLENYTKMMGDIGPHVREWQYQAFLDLQGKGDENIGFVSTYDLRRSWFHPQLKRPAGDRIARWALATQYGFQKDLYWQPAILEKVTPVDGFLRVKFDRRVAAVSDGGALEGFAIAGENREFHPAKAESLPVSDNQLDHEGIALSSPMVPKPIHFRYAWGRNPMGNAVSNPDVPLATQRSDDWYFGEVVEDGKLVRHNYRQIPLRYQKLDAKRAIKEAQMVLEQLKE